MAPGHYHGALYDVFQLADVAVPGQRHQHLHGIGRDRGDVAAHPFGDLLDEEIDQ